MTYISNRPFENFGAASNLAAALNSVVEYDNRYGLSSIAFHLTPPTGATVVFESTFDGTNWISSKMRSMDDDEYTSIATAADVYIGSIVAARKFRVRVSVAGSGTGTVTGRAHKEMSVLEGIEHGNRPDSIGNVLVHKDFAFVAAQTGTVLWTPSTGRKFVVSDLMFSCDGANEVTVFDETNSSGNVVFKTKLTNAEGNVICPFSLPFVSAATNNSLRITTTTAQDIRGTVHGYEIT